MKPVRYPLVWGVVATNLALAACGSGSSSSNDASGGAAGNASGGGSAQGSGGNTGGLGGEVVEPRGACPRETQVGRFTVARQPDFPVVQGTVFDGVVPTAIPEVVGEQHGCTVLRRRNLGCIPPCDPTSETCGEDGHCIPYPRQIPVGTVTISGLTKPVEMEPLSPGATYFASGIDNPPFVPGSEILLVAAGTDERSGFRLAGRGFTPLVEAPTWVLEQGQPLSIDWEPAPESVGTRVAIELTIDQHGVTPLSLSCDFEDTGSAEVPRSIVNQLITIGVSGFPNGRITRQTIDHLDIDAGCVELVVGSPVVATVRVAGYTPCKGPDDCPSGQTCNTAKQLCQ